MSRTAPIDTPMPPAEEIEPPRVHLEDLDILWFQVAGTLCNLACTHCFISCSPANHTHEMMTLEQVRTHLDDARALGVREIYFTGGEPFANRKIEAMIEAALDLAPVTILTNGLLLDGARCRRLAALAAGSPYSLDLRVSLDGYSAEQNDPIRGAGTFAKVLEAMRDAVHAGLNPVLTVTEALDESRSVEGRERFFDLLRSLGIDKPRLKILPMFRLGAEVDRTFGYETWQRLRHSDAGPDGWRHLQCSGCRMVTDQGVWVCPILVNEPSARMGERLADALGSFPLSHPACWTCHVEGVSCAT